MKRFRQSLLTLVTGILLQASVLAFACYEAGASGYDHDGSSPQPAPFDPFASYGYAAPLAAKPSFDGGAPDRPAPNFGAAFPVAPSPTASALLNLGLPADYASLPLYLRTLRLRV